MIRFLYAQGFGGLTGLLQIIAIHAMVNIDSEIDKESIVPQNLETALILVSQIVAECWIAVLTPIDGYHIQVWIQSQLFIWLFTTQQYIDNKIKQVYDFLTLIVLAYQIINLFDRAFSQDTSILNVENLIPIAIILLVLLIITLMNGLGAGDLLIYTALQVHYITYAVSPWFIMIVSILIGQVLFILQNILDVIRKKDIGKQRPFTMFLQIAAIFTFA